MKNSNPFQKDRPTQPKAEHTGAVVLAILAAAALGGWYIMERDDLDDARPLPVVQQPIMPPATTDMPSDLPGHTHYTVFQDSPSQPAKP